MYYLTESIVAAKNQVLELQQDQVECANSLRNCNGDLRCSLTAHHQLMSDVRSILKTLAKCESENGPVFHYLDKYRQFSELCSSLSRHLALKEYDVAKMVEIRAEIVDLQSFIGIGGFFL